ncbi:MAG: alpha-glucosidase [Bacillota bacterium]|nr:alpha-glucosidase [Bacillota bacterium]
MLDKTQKDWWKKAVFYQIYPKSFQDTTGNGVGDLQGIIEHLDYLETLGIDGIWLSPVFASPQVDNGYDISNYREIDAMFGTKEDMVKLIQEAKKRGISIILDMVLNHTSDKHEWFQQAIQSKDNPYHDYYIFRDGKEGEYPNDMKAVFGGPAWKWIPSLEQYYFFQFSPQQPDLNWENEKVREELYDMIRMWKSLGVEGFRLDVIDQIAKEPDNHITNNGPKLHTYLQEMREKAFVDNQIVTIGEAWGANIENASLFCGEERNELSMVFQFEHMCLDQENEKWDVKDLDLVQLKDIYNKWQQALYQKGWNSLFLDNHDLPRIVSRWGNDTLYRKESAKMLAIFLHGMQGTPFIYQGEEIGMTNCKMDIHEYQDLEILNMFADRISKGYKKEDIMDSIYARGRDNARTPMQFSNTKNGGFSTGKPWIKVNENYKEINVEEALQDKDSIFYTYQKLISIRKHYPILQEGSFTLIEPKDPDTFMYKRESEEDTMVILCNWREKEKKIILDKEWISGDILVSNYKDILLQEEMVLRPYEAMMIYVRRK